MSAFLSQVAAASLELTNPSTEGSNTTNPSPEGSNTNNQGTGRSLPSREDSRGSIRRLEGCDTPTLRHMLDRLNTVDGHITARLARRNFFLR